MLSHSACQWYILYVMCFSLWRRKYRLDDIIIRPDDIVILPHNIIISLDESLIRPGELHVVWANYLSPGRYIFVFFTWHLQAAVVFMHKNVRLYVTYPWRKDWSHTVSAVGVKPISIACFGYQILYLIIETLTITASWFSNTICKHAYNLTLKCQEKWLEELQFNGKFRPAMRVFFLF